MHDNTLLWLVAGALLCGSELFFPTQFILFLMGLNALIVGGLTLIIPSFALQVLCWLLLSSLGVWLLKRLYQPKGTKLKSLETQEAETLTEILPGKTGRVLYEGNSWSAKLVDQSSAIAPHQKVYVVRREGNTLIVIPEQFLID